MSMRMSNFVKTIYLKMIRISVRFWNEMNNL